MWVYKQHQIEGATWALKTLREYGLAYLAWKERTRKTGTSLLTVENSKATSCLIITKKKAIPGWEEHIENHNLTKSYTVINYESAHKIIGTFDFIILDEAHHAISSFPKPSKTWKTIAKLVHTKPILYLSATPYAENLGLIFHQLKLSSWTPLTYTTGYNFFRVYGIPSMTRTSYGLQETYSKFKDKEILDKIQHLFSFKTRDEVGIIHEPTVKIIKVELTSETKSLIYLWTKNKVIYIDDEQIIGDTDSKIRTVHYQLEGGTIKVDNSYLEVHKTCEKLQYILDNYNLGDIAIMAHFIGERDMLSNSLPGVPIYSSDGDAEGVDLSHIKKLIIYSMSFRTSKYTQRLARQANHDRTEPIEVDILVVDKPGIGYDIYKTVALKEENFNKNSYDLIQRG